VSRQARLIGTITLVILALLIVVIVAALGPGAAGAADPSPSPSATPAAEPPATAAEVATSLKSRKAAVKARKALSRVRRCFGSRHPVAVGAAPERAATAQEWEKAEAHWIHQTEDWRAKVKAGRHLMTHPPGAASGQKWLPLARWAGWPERPLHTLAGLIWCGSSGIKTNISPTDDWGLTQLNRLSWEARFRQVMHAAWIKTLDPEYNLRFALWIWRDQGGRFKPAWAHDPAVEAVE
jgi:hypothetical protein